MTDRVLIATRSFGSTSHKPVRLLEAAGCELIKADMSQPITEDRLGDMLVGMDAAIIGLLPITARVLERAPTLKIVCAYGTGFDYIDLKAAARLGIAVANCPGGSAESVADLTFGLMIGAARNIPQMGKALKQGDWGRSHSVELWRKILGIVGLGRIGRAVARRAIGFDMTVLACDPFLGADGNAVQQVKMVPFEDLIRQADFISLHTPLTDETRNIIGPVELAAMKPGVYLINTARGGLIDEAALYQALSGGRIAGAALDVFASEPPTDSPLLDLDNLVPTPHIGAHTSEAIERVGIMAARNVIACLKGEAPPYRVN